VPLSNVEARARHDRETIDVHRNEDELRRVVSDVALEVERTVGDVESARKRVEAARVARELAEENLRDQLKRYAVGMVTTTDVLSSSKTT
jgi:outer membrane protein TolC